MSRATMRAVTFCWADHAIVKRMKEAEYERVLLAVNQGDQSVTFMDNLGNETTLRTQGMTHLYARPLDEYPEPEPEADDSNEEE